MFDRKRKESKEVITPFGLSLEKSGMSKENFNGANFVILCSYTMALRQISWFATFVVEGSDQRHFVVRVCSFDSRILSSTINFPKYGNLGRSVRDLESFQRGQHQPAVFNVIQLVVEFVSFAAWTCSKYTL